MAQPWLDVAAPAPPWFGSGEDSSLRGADLDAAYHAFMHAPEWWLRGRSEEAAKAAAQWGYEEEIEQLDELDQESPDAEQPDHTAHRGIAGEIEQIARQQEAQSSPPAASAAPPSEGYQTYGADEMVEEEKGGRARGCLLWMISLLGIGALVLGVLFSLDVVSLPRQAVSPGISPDPDARADCVGRRPVPR